MVAVPCLPEQGQGCVPRGAACQAGRPQGSHWGSPSPPLASPAGCSKAAREFGPVQQQGTQGLLDLSGQMLFPP